MTKRQLIDEILMRNRSAKAAFLARFEEIDLNQYLSQLIVAKQPTLSGDSHRYDKYFVNVQRLPAEQAPSFEKVELPLAAEKVQPQDEPAEPEMASNAPTAAEPTALFAAGNQDMTPAEPKTNEQPVMEMFRNAFQPEIQPAAEQAQETLEESEEVAVAAQAEPTNEELPETAPAASTDDEDDHRDEEIEAEDATAEADEEAAPAIEPEPAEEIEATDEAESMGDPNDEAGDDAEEVPQEEPVKPSPKRMYVPVVAEPEPVAVGAADANREQDKDGSDSWLF